jgi:hypothetical protein
MSTGHAPWSDSLALELNSRLTADKDSSMQADALALVREITARHRDHFRLDFENVHPFWPGLASTLLVEELVRDVAVQLSYHLVILNGHLAASKYALLQEVAKAYAFPDPEAQSRNWDDVLDWIRDLDWIINPKTGDTVPQGFVLLYRDPQDLFTSSPQDFRTILEIMLSGFQIQMDSGIPFHLVLGPVDYKMGVFISQLPFPGRICNSCKSGPLRLLRGSPC